MVHEWVGVVSLDHLRVARDGSKIQFLHRQAGHHDAQKLGGNRHYRAHQVLCRHRRRRKHHQVVVVWTFDTVSEHNAAAHAVPEHDALAPGIFPGGDPNEGVEVSGVLGDVSH
ncbi:Uncharacterised protein [Mycobacterium tuberculosis]|nr:Uncharacterised protein [Mycobacterium tuberculosis]